MTAIKCKYTQNQVRSNLYYLSSLLDQLNNINYVPDLISFKPILF